MTDTTSTDPHGLERAGDPRDFLRPFWRRKWLVAAIVVIAAGGAYAIGKLHHSHPGPRQYVSSAELYITTADPTTMVGPTVGPPFAPDGQDMANMSALLTDQQSTAAVYKRLGLPVGSAGSVTAAPDHIGLAASNGTSILVITAQSPSARLAAKLANTYASVFLASREQRYAAAARSQATANRQELNALSNTKANEQARSGFTSALATLVTEASNPNAEAYPIQTAGVPTTPIPAAAPRSPTADALIGAGVGLLLGLAIAFGIAAFDRRLTQVAAIGDGYKREVLAVLPHVADAAPQVDGHAVIPATLIEALRALRMTVRLAGEKRGAQTLLVTSAMPGEGKSTLARNLALVCAEGGERVLLIDADLRRPSVPQIFGIEAERGVTDVLAGTVSPGNAVVRVMRGPEAPSSNGGPAAPAGFDAPIRTEGGSLDILTHGQLHANPVALFSSPAMELLLSSARAQYDLVIVDSAPILAVTDTMPLLDKVDGVLIVARLGVTTRDAATRLNEMLSRVSDAPILGVVANDMRDTVLDKGGYAGMYSSHYGGYGYRGKSGEPVRSS